MTSYKKILRYLACLLLFLGLLNLVIYFQQASMLFHPVRALQATPADWGLNYEDVFIETTDGLQLHAWYIPAPKAQRTLLFFHGNAGNISHRGDSLAIFQRLGLNVLIIDYRGYGRSQGRPSEKGFYQDARAAWNYLTQTLGVADKHIIIFGRSLGGAIAAQLAAQVNPGGLILESTFSSVRHVAREVFPLLSRLVVLRYDFNTLEHVQALSCPLLVLHSPQDELVPFYLSEQVYASASQPKVFVRMQGGHNNGFLQSQPDYERALQGFLSKYLYAR